MYDTKQSLKSINRHLRRQHVMEGGRAFGVDKITWILTHPDIANRFSQIANIHYETEGKFYFPVAIRN